jgi:hypothetical protein
MQKATASLLLHPLLIGSLLVLIWNDAWGKYVYPGVLTGKLSDFAGLIVFPVFCRVLFPNLSKRMLLKTCAAFFIWWKLPLSQPLINLLNENFNWPVQRVVDYTDLFALVVLPVAAWIQPKSIPLTPILSGCLRWILGFVTFFSLCSTSVYRQMFQAHPLLDDIYFGESFSIKQPAPALLQTLSEKGITYRMDSVMYYPITNQNALYYKVQTQNDSGFVWQPVSSKKDSTLFLKWEGRPFYLIPEYKTENRTFRNIRFTIAENKKKTKTTITIQMFQVEGVKNYLAMDKKIKRMYLKIFTGIFSQP